MDGPGGTDTAQVSALATELAASRSPMSLGVPTIEAARWVYEDPPRSLNDEDFIEAGAFPWAELSDEWSDSVSDALAFLGVVLRLTVCSPRATAGRIWTLYGRCAGKPFFRLTIGRAEICVISWRYGQQSIKLRAAETPIAAAFERGQLTAADLDNNGIIDRDDDMLRSPGPDQAQLICPDVSSAMWLLTKPPMTCAARLFNVRLATSVRATPYAKTHCPGLAAAAWHDAPLLLNEAWAAGG